MKQRAKRLIRTAAGAWLLALIACSIILLIFFPDLFNPKA